MTFATTSLIGSLLRIENLMRCDICLGLIRNARTLNECGHRFCFDCIYHRLGSERKCPTCNLPAIVKNLRPDPMHDTLVACVQKLKIKVAPPIPSFEYPTFSGLGSGSMLSTATPNAITADGTLGSDMSCEKRASTSANPVSGSSDHAAHPPTSAALSLSRQYQRSREGLSHSTLSSLGMGIDDINALLCNEDLPDDERPQQKHDTHPSDPPPQLPLRPCVTPQMPLLSCSSMDAITDIDALFKESDLPDDEKAQKPKSGVIHRWDENTEKPTPVNTQSGPSPKRLRTTTPPASPPLPLPCPIRLSSPQGDQQQTVLGIIPPFLEQNEGNKQPHPSALEAHASLPTASSITEKELPSLSFHESEDLPTLQQDHSVIFSGSSTTSLIHLMFTGVSDLESQEYVDLVAASGLHVELCLNMKQFDRVTHLVTAKDDMGLSPRTEKYLRGILAGIWIVDRSWVIESCRARKWLPEEGFEVLGDAMTGQTLGPRRGRLGKSQELLFEGLRFCFFGKRYPNRELIMLLCRAAGGNVLSRRPPAPNRDGVQQVCGDHDLENDVIDSEQPIIVIDDEKHLSTKAGKSLAHYQVRATSWVLNCISSFRRPICKISACTNSEFP